MISLKNARHGSAGCAVGPKHQARYLRALAGRRDKRTPWYAKLIALLVAGYAISPIDLIPDFIPVLGYLDDVIIVPLGIMLAVRLIPKPLMAELREQAQKRVDNPTGRMAAAMIILLWLLCLGLLARYLDQHW